jgi:formylglycine-generating enzyme required for sulfatase activity
MRFCSAALVFPVAAFALGACISLRDDRPGPFDIDMESPARRAGARGARDGAPQTTAPEAQAGDWPDLAAPAPDAGLDAAPEGDLPPASDASLEPDASFETDASLEPDAAPASCETMVCRCPRGMVLVPTRDGSPYCIDAAEVSNGEYELFLESNPSPDASPGCSFTKLIPGGDWPKPERLTHPVTGINWCDAYLYCAWAHKHLCGRIGGGSYAPLDANDYTKSEWFNACSRAGAMSYPYGGKYVAGRCNGSDGEDEQEEEQGHGDGVDAQPSPPPTWGSDDEHSGRCEGLPGLYNMSGNVWEWEDSCTSPLDAPDADVLISGDGGISRSDACFARGGSFASSATGLACNASSLVPFPLLTRGASSPEIGFRCCW